MVRPFTGTGGSPPLNSEKFMHRAVYRNVLKFLENKNLRPIYLRDCIKMVQYHDRLPTLSILNTLGPEKVVLIRFQG